MGKLLMELREEILGIKSNFIRIKPANIKRALNNSRNNSNKNTQRRNKMNNARKRKQMRTQKLRK